MILESMKMEIPITTPITGTVKQILVAEGRGGPGGPDGRRRRVTPERRSPSRDGAEQPLAGVRR